jgi:hypothetical protein
MAGKSSTFENELLLHIFNDSSIPYVGDATGLPAAGTEGNLYVALHTSAPIDGDTQDLKETTYTDYVRLVVPRNTTWWTVTGSSCSPAQDFDFIECGATPGAAISHFSIGKEAAGGGGGEDILYWGAVTPPITMATGVIPRIKTTSTITED